MFTKIIKGVAGLTVVGTAGLGCYIAADEGRRRSFKFCTTAGPMVYAYQGVTDEVKKRELHQKYAPELLKLCTDLGGYYIKLGQTVCGLGLLPEEYEEELSVLLDNCPTKPFSIIKSVIEKDLGKPLNEIYESFEENPIGSGSIGQVHRATLKDGRKVIVKVQYPDVENYFRMDFKTINAFIQLDPNYAGNEKMKDIMEGIRCTFDNEFDYRKEARNMRLCRKNCLSKFAKKIYIPDYYDDFCSAKVLTMEEIPGVPIRTTLKHLVKEYATKENLTVSEFKKQMKEKFKDPQEYRKLMSESGPSETMMDVYIGITKASNAISSAIGTLGGYNIVKSTVPINGPRILRVLNEVHSHQVFVDGVYNSDPHAGNVLMMEDGRLGLIDYGGVATMDKNQRKTLAKLLVAISDQDDDKTIQYVKEFGMTSAKSDRTFMLAYALMCFHRGLNMDDMARVGVPKDIAPLEVEIWLNENCDKLESCEPQVITIQRCLGVLLGISGELSGGGSVSIAEMWREPAIKYLKSVGETV